MQSALSSSQTAHGDTQSPPANTNPGCVSINHHLFLLAFFFLNEKVVIPFLFLLLGIPCLLAPHSGFKDFGFKWEQCKGVWAAGAAWEQLSLAQTPGRITFDSAYPSSWDPLRSCLWRHARLNSLVQRKSEVREGSAVIWVSIKVLWVQFSLPQSSTRRKSTGRTLHARRSELMQRLWYLHVSWILSAALGPLWDSPGMGWHHAECSYLALQSPRNTSVGSQHLQTIPKHCNHFP